MNRKKELAIRTLFKFFLIALVSSCVTAGNAEFSGYEDKRLIVQVVSLFPQLKTPSVEDSNWTGDWIFRRERMDLLDKQLSEIKPDIILLQDLVFRKYSPGESEFNLLASGALTDYDWHITKTGMIAETEETTASALAMALPLKIELLKTLNSKSKWDIGEENSYVIFTRFKTLEGDAGFISVKLDSLNSGFWYKRISDAISSLISSSGICPERFIIAGRLPEDKIEGSDYEMFSKLGFKDAASEFCSDLRVCYTEDQKNPIRRKIQTDAINQRSLRIFVHGRTNVYSGLRNLMRTRVFPDKESKYGLKEYSASDSYGWISSLGFPTCGS